MASSLLWIVRLFFTGLMFIWHNCYAQSDVWELNHFTVLDGLSDNYITAISQDSRGYLWIGTTSGLDLYDGHEFRSPEFSGIDASALASTEIRALSQTVGGMMALATQTGLYRLNTSDNTLALISSPDTSIFSVYANDFTDGEVLEDGSVVATSRTGFFQFSRDGSVGYQYNAYGPGDVDRTRLFFGRSIFRTGSNSIVLNAENNTGYTYSSDVGSLTPIRTGDSVLGRFYAPDDRSWLSKSQVGEHSFVFIASPSEVWFIDAWSGATMTSGYNAALVEELSWESRGLLLNDTTLFVNTRASGFLEFRIDKRTRSLQLQPNRYLDGYKVTCLFLDASGGLWAGTSEGLFHFDNQAREIQTFSLPVNDLLTIGYQDGIVHGDKLYLARYSRKVGLVVVDVESMSVEKEVTFFSDDDQRNEAYMLQEYKSDTLWLATNRGLVWYAIASGDYGMVADLLQSEWPNAPIRYLAPPDKMGYALMCGWLSGTAFRYHIPTGTVARFDLNSTPAVPFKRIKQIVTDNEGNDWFSGHSLARFNRKTTEFDTVMSVYAGAFKFNDDILVIQADDNGSLWLHNPHNGLLEYRIADRRFLNYTVEHGLPSNTLRSFSPVWRDVFWIASHQHLTRWHTRTHATRILGINEGYPTRFPFARNILLDTIREFGYLVYANDVARFPLSLTDVRGVQPPVVIEKIAAHGGNAILFPDSVVEFKAGENTITVCFTQIDFTSVSEADYAYRLNGGQWLAIQDGRCINLMDMQPGTYRLEVQAQQLGKETALASCNFSIAPHPWQTWWFRAAVLLSVVLGVVLVYRYRVRRVRERANFDKLLSETELQVLHAQMNPHFIFNSLNSIREMILLKENQDASRYLTKFAHLIRLTLENSRASFITLRQTLDYLARYVEMEQVRNSEFTYEIHVDRALNVDELLVPPMLVQPLVENAIWHGAVGIDGQLEISISFKVVQEQLICEVTDNGIGYCRSLERKSNGPGMHRSLGIDNVRHRLELLNKKYGVQARLEIHDLSSTGMTGDTGTNAILHLPLLYRNS